MVKNRFRVLLAERKKKMADVERETGLSKNCIRGLYYETAKGIRFETLEKLCNYLQCDIGDLFELEEEAV